MKHNLSNMIGLDMYLSSLNSDEFRDIEDQILISDVKAMPLLSWDIFSEHHVNQLIQSRRNHDIKKIKSMARRLKWKNDINDIFEGNTFEAIVVTDLHQKIVWVNDGFTNMTGYSKKEVADKRPGFLQGAKTTYESKERFRKKLSDIRPFTEIIVNYKKNKEPYNCEVKVFPLFTEEMTHYIALERQVV